MEELFYWCTDNNNTLVINIPPDKTGNIREYEANAIMELAKRIGIKKDKPLPKNGELLSLNSEVIPSSVFKKIFNYMVENTQQMEVCKLCGELRIQ